MRKTSLLILIGIVSALAGCINETTYTWNPAPNPLMTRWASDVDAAMPWPAYPRPQLVRDEWMNLNGLWDYQLQKKGEVPASYTRKILVPYPVESSLSGVADSVGPDDMIWYRRDFEIPAQWEGKEVLLHFEAVDWETSVFVNGEEVGNHRGGYDPFTFNITDFVRDYKINELVVTVSDPTDKGYQPRGKQVLKPGGIWYTPTSGIWQTVWLEPVPQFRIIDALITSMPTENRVVFTVNCQDYIQGDIIHITINDKNNVVAKSSAENNENIIIELKDPELWSPSSPFLYDVNIMLERDGKAIDEVKSYFGMREIHTGLDDKGFVRLFLNGEAVFQNGPLDQGFWPDGLYTPPTDEAMKTDIQLTKDMGFNMLRKHVKVENRRFYYWCDKLGIMVWQDMPSTSGYVAPGKPDLDRPDHEMSQFKYELEQMIKTKINHPSIVMWVPFNEGWGQFDTEGIVNFIYSLDDSRLVNNTSGWADRGVGDVIDIHNYPDPRFPEPESERASVLGEFGGLGLYVEGHTWEEKNWGYKKMNDSSSLLIKYEQFYTAVWEMMENNGLAASIYTQTSDVETETNGLMTYDREITKMHPGILHGINTNNYVPAPQFTVEESTFNKSVAVELIIARGVEVRYTLDGSIPSSGSEIYDGPVELNKSTLFSVAAFKDAVMSIVVKKEFTLTEKKPPVYYNPFDTRYSGGGIYALVDGKHGGLSFSDGYWQGYRNNGIDVVIDLGMVQKITSVSGNFLSRHEGWIFLPQTFSVSTSNDLQEYTLQGEIKRETATEFLEPEIHLITIDGLDVEARYVRVKASSIGPAPEWHKPARGRPTWLFIDEIIIE